MKKAIIFLSAILILTGCTRQSENKAAQRVNKATIESLWLPAIFNDNMVLQQKDKVPFWGKAQPGENVVVKGSWGESAQTKTNREGKWQLTLATTAAGGTFTVTVKGNSSTITYQNVLLGEVWVCSGQSNMEMPLEGWPPVSPVNNSDWEIQHADFPQIHLFNVQRSIAITPKSDCKGKWVVCSPQTAAGFSATAYFFGRKLHRELGVPIGLIETSWGGTPAESWTSGEFLGKTKDFAPIVEKLPQVEAQFNLLKKWLLEHKTIDISDKPDETRWKDLNFNDRECADPAFDDNDWHEMKLPVLWESTAVGQFDGVIWFRRVFSVPDAWLGKPAIVELGPIDDMEVTYINGVEVGGYEQPGEWQRHRKYKIEAGIIKSGKNIIAVRVLDNQGGGGIYGKPEQMKVYLGDSEAVQTVSLAGKWKYLPVAEYSNNQFYVFGGQNNDYFKRPQLSVQLSSQTPTILYNAMIAPLIPYGIRGVIWYQGETNTGNPAQYGWLFPLMIKNWRADWKRGDFPFYFTQIAPFDYGDMTKSQELREAQMLTLKTLNTGMAVTMDIGDPTNIHPENKQEVGRRLALWALAKDYGRKNLPYSGPIYKSMRVEGRRIRVKFEPWSLGRGLIAGEKGLQQLAIAGSDHIFYPAKGEIEGNDLMVFSRKVTNPIAVRYCWNNAARVDLFNKARLPASSFRTDNLN